MGERLAQWLHIHVTVAMMWWVTPHAPVSTMGNGLVKSPYVEKVHTFSVRCINSMFFSALVPGFTSLCV